MTAATKTVCWNILEGENIGKYFHNEILTLQFAFSGSGHCSVLFTVLFAFIVGTYAYKNVSDLFFILNQVAKA